MSPTRFEQLRTCPLRVAFAQAGVRSTAEQADQLLVGEVVHAAIELLARREYELVDDAWEQATSLVDTQRQSNVRLLAGTRRAMLRLQRRWNELCSVLLNEDVSTLIIEERFESKDGGIEGRPDVVVISGSSAHVVDYKSGIVSGQEGVKAFYERQLRIYAGLVAEKMPVDRVIASLFSLRQGFVEVDVSPELCDREMDAVRDIRDRYNESVPGVQPAMPSPGACSTCPAISQCDAFWSAVEPDWANDAAFRYAGAFVTGSVVKDPEVSQRNEYGLVLEVSAGTVAQGVDARVSGIPVAELDALRIGDDLRVGGLSTTKSGLLHWASSSCVNRPEG